MHHLRGVGIRTGEVFGWTGFLQETDTRGSAFYRAAQGGILPTLGNRRLVLPGVELYSVGEAAGLCGWQGRVCLGLQASVVG